MPLLRNDEYGFSVFNARSPVRAAVRAAGCALLITVCGCVQQPVRSEILVIDPALCAISDAPGTGGGAAGGGISYMFCIPDNPLARAQVARCDPSVRFDESPRGRGVCGVRSVLCIGSTRQPNFKVVLNRLASLPYVKAITLSPFDDAP